MPRGKIKGLSDTVKVPISAIIEAHPLGAAAVIEVRRKWLENVENTLNVKFDLTEVGKVATIPANTEPTTIEGEVDVRKNLTPDPKLITEEEL